MKPQAIHPFFLLMTMAGIVSGLYTIYQRNPSFLPPILGLSLLGLAWRVWQLAREKRREGDAGISVAFEALRGKDVLRYSGWLKENVRGHDAVIDGILKRLQQGLALAGPRRCLGSFLLVGPTGTGKTFLAELLGRALYPGSEPVILRMNQYKDHQDVFTLIGPPPGHPGYEVGGALTRPVLENPYRVVILDEIEKSHPDVQHCLYDVLDAAQCREKSSGRVVHFNACALFATSNAGVESLRAALAAAQDPASRSGRGRQALSKAGGFEKAFLARFQEILLMDELSPLHVAEVACLQLVKHWKQYGIEVTYASPEILFEAMRKNAEFSEYGVRQLAHLVQSLTDPFIEEARRSGVSRVRLDIDRASGRILVAPAEIGA